MQEVPGLLEGALRGGGLGQQFLRHAERTKIYVHLIDGLSDDPAADLTMLNEELRQFGSSLAGKRQIVAVNKVDVTEVNDRREEIAEGLRKASLGAPWRAAGGEAATVDEEGDRPILFISAVTGEGVPELLDRVVEDLAASAGDPVDAELEAAPVVKPQRRGKRRFGHHCVGH